MITREYTFPAFLTVSVLCDPGEPEGTSRQRAFDRAAALGNDAIVGDGGDGYVMVDRDKPGERSDDEGTCPHCGGRLDHIVGGDHAWCPRCEVEWDGSGVELGGGRPERGLRCPGCGGEEFVNTGALVDPHECADCGATIRA